MVDVAAPRAPRRNPFRRRRNNNNNQQTGFTPDVAPPRDPAPQPQPDPTTFGPDVATPTPQTQPDPVSFGPDVPTPAAPMEPDPVNFGPDVPTPAPAAETFIGPPVPPGFNPNQRDDSRDTFSFQGQDAPGAAYVPPDPNTLPAPPNLSLIHI